ncbi:MAG: hypothetical protein M0016_03310 [Deltaproteobacteria bacterium]|jgi:hypothetical protein|nr:hypothetical protein [Deltaproteobacteria bacterium]MCL5879747.1 hypothetical protein [Deltaproteobacteria bacterium]MDA8304176.1 hypothetical protein [Deltaproteobacteria bacterium]
MSDYNLKISGLGLNFEKSIDLNKANKVIKLCIDDFQVASQNDSSKTFKSQSEDTIDAKVRDATTTPTSLSIAEYYKKFAPKRNPDKILIFANYISYYQGLKSFNPEKLKEMFSEVGETTPTNFNRDFKWAKVIGWLDKIPNSKEYYVTNSGKEVLNKNFHSDIIKKTKIPKAWRSKKKKNKQNDPK